jgi:hypothetical protein
VILIHDLMGNYAQLGVIRVLADNSEDILKAILINKQIKLQIFASITTMPHRMVATSNSHLILVSAKTNPT